MYCVYVVVCVYYAFHVSDVFVYLCLSMMFGYLIVLGLCPRGRGPRSSLGGG